MSQQFDDTVPLSADDLEHQDVLFEAMEIYLERNAKRADLWRKYGAEDSLNHMRSKYARCKQIFDLMGQNERVSMQEAMDEALDLINYTVFFMRNAREGRLHPEI